jgi:uncharacterized membrane protein
MGAQQEVRLLTSGLPPSQVDRDRQGGVAPCVQTVVRWQKFSAASDASIAPIHQPWRGAAKTDTPPRMPRARPLPLLILGALTGLLLTFIELDLIEYAYEKAGIPHRLVFSVLVASLFGSMINLPVTRFKRPDGTPGTVLAVNVGGAIIPSALSLYFLAVSHLWGVGLLATLVRAAIIHTVARPVPKLGIAMPAFLPAPIAAGIALLLAPDAAPAIAYAAGSLGTLIGADLTNLHRIGGMGAPVASIGGAGTFDGIFLVGLIAVLLA